MPKARHAMAVAQYNWGPGVLYLPWKVQGQNPGGAPGEEPTDALQIL